MASTTAEPQRNPLSEIIKNNTPVYLDLAPRNDENFQKNFIAAEWKRRLALDEKVLEHVSPFVRWRLGISEKWKMKRFATLEKKRKIWGKKQKNTKSYTWQLLVNLSLWHQWIIFLVTLILPDVNAIMIKEWVFNVRSIPFKVRTGLLILAVVCSTFLDWPLFWEYLKDRLVGASVVTLANTPPAFDLSLRYLYKDPTFIKAAIGGGVAFQYIIQLGSPTIQFLLVFLIGKFPYADNGNIEPIRTEITRLESELSQFSTWANSQGTSSYLKTAISQLKMKIEHQIQIINATLPIHLRIEKKKQKIGPKLPYLFMTPAVAVGGSFIFWEAWLSFSQAFVFGVMVSTRVAILVFSPYQTYADVYNLYSTMVSNLLPTLLGSGVPHRATKGEFFKKRWAYWLMITVQIFVFLFLGKLIDYSLKWVFSMAMKMTVWLGIWAKQFFIYTRLWGACARIINIGIGIADYIRMFLAWAVTGIVSFLGSIFIGTRPGRFYKKMIRRMTSSLREPQTAMLMV